MPAEYAALAELVCRFHLDIHRAFELRPETLLGILEQHGQLSEARAPGAAPARVRSRQAWAAWVCRSDYPQAAYVRAAHSAAASVDARAFVAEGLSGVAIGEAVRKARVRAIAGLREEHRGA